jgi:hypothetical protein
MAGASVSSSALEKAARSSKGDGLIHHPLADPEIFVDPFRNLLVVAGNLLCFETGSGVSQPGYT